MFCLHTFTLFVLNHACPNRTQAHSLEHVWLRSFHWGAFTEAWSLSNGFAGSVCFFLFFSFFVQFNPHLINQIIHESMACDSAPSTSVKLSLSLALILVLVHPRSSEGSRMVIHTVRKRCWIFPRVFSLPVNRLDSDWCSIRFSQSLPLFIVHELMARLTLQDFACLDLDMSYEIWDMRT